MKTKRFLLLLLVLAVLRPAAARPPAMMLDDFSVPGQWAAFDAGNPAPQAAAADGRLTLDTDGGGSKDKVLCRTFPTAPGEKIEFELAADAANSPSSGVYVVLRARRNGPNLITRSIPVKPGEKTLVSISCDGSFSRNGAFTMLIGMHDAGKPMKIILGPIRMERKTPPSPPFRDTPELKRRRVRQLLSARTTQIDTSFPYYHNRSAESIASEIEAAGFNGVYYYVIRREDIIPELIEELQKRGLSVALMTLPSLVYLGEEELAAKLPPCWRDWLMKFTDSRMDIYRFIGFVHPGYNQWYKGYLNGMLKDFNFDGFTFAEIMYPIYDGPELNPPFYGDVSRGFQEAFKKATGNRKFPDFTDPAAPDYFRNNPDLYRDLIEYRVKTVNDFYDDIVNGPDGARAAVPGIMFATWTLGINLPDGVEKLRVWEGNDIAAMIRQVKLDMHFIQTHAPDWSNPALRADYATAYKPFFEAIRRAAPGVRTALQADFGSLARSRRSPEWREEFYRTCREQGIDSTTYYEFSLRDEIYSKPPKLLAARRTAEGVDLIFSQRLGPDSIEVMKKRRIGGTTVTGGTVDGNILRLRLEQPLNPATSLAVPCGGIADLPEVRFPASNVPPEPRGPVNRIPEGTETVVPCRPDIRLKR